MLAILFTEGSFRTLGSPKTSSVRDAVRHRREVCRGSTLGC
jgi:hypothetical protein